MTETEETGFGIDAFALDDRLRLFHFTAADKRVDYLRVLRAFDRARTNYQVLLHSNDVAEHVGGDAAELTPLLDQLHTWRVLDRSYDGARAANLAEYRNRHYVYQFTQAGYRAYRAVEDVLGASVASQVLMLNLPTSDTHVVAAWLRDAAGFGIPFRLTLHQLTVDPLTVAAPDIYVCENPAVLRAAAAELREASAPLICTDGQPSAAHRSPWPDPLARRLRLDRPAHHGDGGRASRRHLVAHEHGRLPGGAGDG